MTLKREIELNRGFESTDEALLLALIHTNQVIERASISFLSRYDLTPTQFNALMIVRDYEKDGIKQAELARRLLINRASTGVLLDHLCGRDLMVRQPVLGDRRAYHLVLTVAARRLLKKILKPYYRRLTRVCCSFSVREKKLALRFLERFRCCLRAEQARLVEL
jgi:DNA-binding MarR family transcriptional regulator